MNIAIFTDAFYPYVSGVVTAVITLAKGLADKGHKVYIIAPEDNIPYKEFSYKNIEVFRVKSYKTFFYEGLRTTLPLSISVFNYLSDKKIDIFHFHTPLSLGMQAILFAKLFNKPLVGTFHTFISDPQYLQHIKMDYKWMQNVAWSYSNFFYNKCDLVTSPSEMTRKELLKHKIKPSVKVISNGIDFKIFDNSKSERIRKKYGNGKIVLFVGRIAHEKNIPYLLKCFKQALYKVPNLKLLIVGGGPQFNDIKHLIHSLNLSKNVFMLGNIKHTNLVKSGIFGACDIFATASVTENQPITILEAQANGLVCIGLNAKGIPDLIKNNKNGFLLQVGDREGFADAIVKLSTNKNLYKRMKKATLRMIKIHELSHVIDEWERTYSSLIKRKKEKLIDFSAIKNTMMLKKLKSQLYKIKESL